jgi:hypothetical protein
VRIVEVIPKSVAADVSELVFSEQPKVLQADPIVEWVLEKVKKGETKDLSYTVKKQLESVESTTLSVFGNCPLVVTYAVNEQTNECKAFAGPCEVPKGWGIVDKCPAIPVIASQGLNLREQLAIYLGILLVLVLIVWLFVYRRPSGPKRYYSLSGEEPKRSHPSRHTPTKRVPKKSK